jgi:hypothetical protein
VVGVQCSKPVIAAPPSGVCAAWAQDSLLAHCRQLFKQQLSGMLGRMRKHVIVRQWGRRLSSQLHEARM